MFSGKGTIVSDDATPVTAINVKTSQPLTGFVNHDRFDSKHGLKAPLAKKKGFPLPT